MNVVARLHAVYRAERSVPFAWGTTDCLCFAAQCAMALGHDDPISHLRGRYRSEYEARRVMVENGWHTLADVAAPMFPEIAPAHAQSGDWAIIINADGTEAIGVVVRSAVMARTPDGLGTVPLTAATRAFRTGPRC